MKNAKYFSHDSNALNDTKILSMLNDYGFEGYGWFWAIVETLREQENFMLKISSKNFFNGFSYKLRTDKDTIINFFNDCINEYELFQTDGEFIWSDSLNDRMSQMNKSSDVAREKANKRWANNNIKKTTEIKIEKPTPKEVTFSAEVESITDSLCRKLRENNEKAKLPADLKKWNSAIEALHRIDGYEFDMIEKVCKWSQDNSFWKQNILSATKLREKFAQLLLAMQEDERRKTNAESKGSFSNGTRTDSEDQRPTINIPINPRIHELDIEAQLAKLRERAKAVGAPV